MLKPFIISAVSLWLVSLLLPGLSFNSLWALGVAAIVLTGVQNVLKPVLSLLLLPITIITLGFFSTFLNVALLWLVTAIVPGFHIDPMTILDTYLSQWVSLIAVSFILSVMELAVKRLW